MISELVTEVTVPRVLGEKHLAAVPGGLAFHAGGHQRRFGAEQRHGLALHVGAHQGAVGVIVLQEGYQGGGHAEYLLGRNVHVVDLVRRLHEDSCSASRASTFSSSELAVLIQPGVGLGDDVFIFLIGGQVDHLVRDEGHDLDRRVGSLASSWPGLGVMIVAGLDDDLALVVLHSFAQGLAHQPVYRCSAPR